WNPDSEEPEAPLVVTGIPDGLLLVAPVVEGRRRRTPRWRQRPEVRRRRRRAPAPRCRAVAPWCSMEAAAPVVVVRVPRRTPIVAVGTAAIAEVGRWGSTRASRSARSTLPTG